MVTTEKPLRRDAGLAAHRAIRPVGTQGGAEFKSQIPGDDLVRDGRRRHRDNDPIDQLVVPLVVRAAVEEFLDGQ